MLFLFTILPLAVSAEELDCDAGKHDYTMTTKESTENEDGETIYTCKLCGFTFSRVLQASGHTWGDWITDKYPACIEPGHKYRFCTRHFNDPHTEEETIPALGHAYKETVMYPTCEEDGFEIYSCERCGDSYTEPFEEAAGHHYIETMKKEPDCEHEGETTLTCEMCGDSYTEPFKEATGHRYIESIKKEPDCEHEGEKTLICEICGDAYTETLPALEHRYGEWIVDQEPTENEEGCRYRVCEHDSSHIIEESIERLITTPNTESYMTEDTDSSFPNTLDMIFISSILATITGFGMAIRQDLHILRWEKKEAISYLDWLKKNGYK